jgi:hypothetical protein
MTLEISREEAQELAWGDHDSSKYEIIENVITSTSRWSENHRMVIKHLETGKFYESYYSQGLTEYQDESPYEYGNVLFEEVVPVEKTIIVYETPSTK